MDWTRGSTIGHGSFATVSVATSHHSGDVLAVKSAELSQSKILQREQKILSSLSSPHIVTYKGCDITQEENKHFYNLFMEYAPGGSLADQIHKQKGKFGESTIGFYVQKVVQGLEYLHSLGLVHCDIKAQNILVSEENAKIADFGCAKWADRRIEDFRREDEEVRISGTPVFMAPEVARGQEQGCPADIWALGCTMIEMATNGSSPWPNATDPVSILYQIGFSSDLPTFPDFFSDQAKDFLGKCLMRDPRERWTASELLKHPFLGEFNSIPKEIQDSNSRSPTSILDQDIWNSFEDSQIQSNPDRTSSKNSPVDRIRRLSMISKGPSWDFDENWVSVRIDESEGEWNLFSGLDSESSGNDMEELECPVLFSDRNVSSRNLVACKFVEDNIVVRDLNLERLTDDLLPLSSISRFL